MKTSKMTRLLGKTLLVITCILGGCATDRYKADGRIIKLDGKYYRMDNRISNAYVLEPINMDTITVLK